jgi:hypothetical protein
MLDKLMAVEDLIIGAPGDEVVAPGNPYPEGKSYVNHPSHHH